MGSAPKWALDQYILKKEPGLPLEHAVAVAQRIKVKSFFGKKPEKPESLSLRASDLAAASRMWIYWSRAPVIQRTNVAAS